jgi:SLT domain-containing protein
VFLQWQSYSPLHLTVSQQALLSTDLVKVGVDGKPQQVQPVSTLVQKQQTNNKRAKQLTEEARQYPNMNEQSPSVNTVVGSVGYGDEALVLQRYQELLKE